MLVHTCRPDDDIYVDPKRCWGRFFVTKEIDHATIVRRTCTVNTGAVTLSDTYGGSGECDILQRGPVVLGHSLYCVWWCGRAAGRGHALIGGNGQYTTHCRPTWYLRFRRFELINVKNSDIFIYLTNTRTTVEMPKVEKKGIRLSLDCGIDGAVRGEGCGAVFEQELVGTDDNLVSFGTQVAVMDDAAGQWRALSSSYGRGRRAVGARSSRLLRPAPQVSGYAPIGWYGRHRRPGRALRS